MACVTKARLRRCHVVGRVLAVVVLAAGMLAGSAWALDPRVPAPPQSRVVPLPVPVPGNCWMDTRIFYTLRWGPVAFCRRNLRYIPGALECYQFLDRVCATPDPVNGWVYSRSPIDADVFPCPAGPEPPVCRTLDLGALP